MNIFSNASPREDGESDHHRGAGVGQSQLGDTRTGRIDGRQAMHVEAATSTASALLQEKEIARCSRVSE